MSRTHTLLVTGGAGFIGANLVHHLARAWAQTYGLPVITTNCSNNYGPYQFPEKFVPLAILAALEGRPVPVYGDGRQMRDWVYVTDHVRALVAILEGGKSGKVYCVGGGVEKRNLQVAQAICDVVDELAPKLKHRRRNLITHVEDRSGHDRRYAMDAARLQRELGVRPRESFRTGLRKTVRWYLENRTWWGQVRDGSYRGERLGLASADGTR